MGEHEGAEREDRRDPDTDVDAVEPAGDVAIGTEVQGDAGTKLANAASMKVPLRMRSGFIRHFPTDFVATPHRAGTARSKVRPNRSS